MIEEVRFDEQMVDDVSETRIRQKASEKVDSLAIAIETWGLVSVIIISEDDDDEIVCQVIRIFPSRFSSSLTENRSFSANGFAGRNKPLNRSACRPKWKSEVPITENQLRRKREEYWDTGGGKRDRADCVTFFALF